MSTERGDPPGPVSVRSPLANAPVVDFSSPSSASAPACPGSGRRLLLEVAMPLWVGGLVLSILGLGRLVLPFSGEAFEWGEYLMLGILFPVLTIAIGAPRGRGPFRDLWIGATQTVATAVCVLGGVAFVVWHAGAPLLALAAATWALGILLYRRGAGRALAPMTPAELFVGLFLVTTSWAVSSRLVSWVPFLTLVSRSSYTLSVVLGAGALTTFALCRPISGVSRPLVRWTATLIGLATLAFSSVRVQPMESVAVHHWGVAVGPAQLVRQGGWLLWDVPAQYGFLSTLTVAAVPTQTIWDAFYLVHVTLLFLSASVLFLLLRGPGGLVAGAFALILTVVAVFLLPGSPGGLSGPWIVPNVGPFRFFWCHALLAILFWHCRTSPPRRSAALAIGTLAWLIGTLWSVESAAYCAVIWLPAYAQVVTRECGGRLVRILWQLSIPPLLLLSAGLVLVALYRARLGHGPDWRAFVEYAMAFLGGFKALPIDGQGVVWTLVLIAATVATVGLRLYARRDSPPTLALAWGAWGAIWATSSYFVSRSHEVNATNLAPVFCVALAIALRLLPPPAGDPVSRLVRLTLVPVFAAMLAITLGNADGLRRFVTDPRPAHRVAIDALLPRADAALVDLLTEAHVGGGDPVAYIGFALNPLPSRPTPGEPERWTASHQAWLPTDPVALFMPLAEQRSRTYVRRFIRRTRLGGWLIQIKPSHRDFDPEYEIPWLRDEVRRTHTPTVVYENSEWRLTRFELK